jgi:hypothetical protein
MIAEFEKKVADIYIYWLIHPMELRNAFEQIKTAEKGLGNAVRRFLTR